MLVPIQFLSDESGECIKKESVQIGTAIDSGNRKINEQVNSLRYDLCLIDDDIELIHLAWKWAAEIRGLKIKTFSSPAEFYENTEHIDRKTPLFVDVSLGEGNNGIEFATNLYDLGFENISIATGYPADSIEVPFFIKQVVGKNFPDKI